jgi:flagellar hook-associated protein 3 FlgL
MKISTTWSHQLSLNAMLSQQSKVNQSQLKLATGLNYLKPSEAPLDNAQVMAFQQRIDEIKQFQDNLQMGKQRLELEETTLKSSLEIMHRIKDLGIQGINGINNQTDLDSIADEIDQMGAQLLNLANSKNANGEYLFSGMMTKQIPFQAGTPFVYQGDSNQRQIQINDNQSLPDGDPGNSIFGPTNSTSADSVFDVIKEITNELRAGGLQASTLGKLDATFENIITTESAVGARLNVIDKQLNAHEDYILDIETAQSQLKDLDYASAISQFNQQALALQASQQAFAKVQDLSLFKFI